MIAGYIAQKMFVLIVGNHFEEIWKRLSDSGFKSLKILPISEERQINKHNVICVSPLGVCCDLLKFYSFDRVIIDEAHNVP